MIANRNHSGPGFAHIAHAIGGLSYLAGFPGETPVVPGTAPLGDYMSSLYGVIGVMLALRDKAKTGLGQVIDVGIYDKGRPTAPVVSIEDVLRLQDVVRHVHMDRALMLYASQLVDATRHPSRSLPKQIARLVEYGASPRATIAFCKAARAQAVLSGRAHVLPEDIAKLAHRVLRHRLILGFEAASANITPEIVIDTALRAVRVP